jgi:hypothetical protein
VRLGGSIVVVVVVSFDGVVLLWPSLKK